LKTLPSRPAKKGDMTAEADPLVADFVKLKKELTEEGDAVACHASKCSELWVFFSASVSVLSKPSVAIARFLRAVTGARCLPLR
jgi:hypothetical protein